MRFTGKLKTWTDGRGFGFITPTQGGQDIFVHISEYPRGRTPAVDEMLSFEVALNREGKKKAVKVQLAGASPARTPPGSDPRASRVTTSRRAPATTGGLAKGLVVLVILVLAGWAGYRHYSQTLQSATSPRSLEQQQRARAVGLPEPKTSSPFSCDGRTHCSQMTSCAEATFFLKNCPGTQMDGDGDGVPCERQLCN
jgi:cold shock CspA family protein